MEKKTLTLYIFGVLINTVLVIISGYLGRRVLYQTPANSVTTMILGGFGIILGVLIVFGVLEGLKTVNTKESPFEICALGGIFGGLQSFVTSAIVSFSPEMLRNFTLGIGTRILFVTIMLSFGAASGVCIGGLAFGLKNRQADC